ncbi:hypothetical protein [Methylovulum psychrotolerans]|nr:hypothetical protein [Methylovulum psychrotolerans]
MMIDLLTCAKENIIPLEEQCTQTLSGLDDYKTVQAKAFKQWVADNAHISVNMGYFVAHLLAKGQRYKNCYEVADANGTEIDIPNKKFLGRRLAFDAAVANSRQFKYGALNGGCCGLQTYYQGPCCVLLDADFSEKLTAFCLAGNSLKHYFPDVDISHADTNRLDDSKLQADVAPYSYRHCFATLQRIDELSQRDKEEWARILLDDAQGRYFEIIFLEGFSREDLKEIRISHKEYSKIKSLTKEKSKRPLTLEEIDTLAYYKTILENCNKPQKIDQAGYFKLEPKKKL